VSEAGFTSGAEAHDANIDGKDSEILLLEYPTPQLAEQHCGTLNTLSPAESSGDDH